MSEPTEFDLLRAQREAGGADAVIDALCARLKAEGRLHELFDARLLEARRRLGLPLIQSRLSDELPEDRQTALEDAYLTACREVGGLFLARDQFREAWMYLRPAGGKGAIAARLANYQPRAEELESIVEIAVYQGAAPSRGLELLLEHYGTCTAISTLESSWNAWAARDRRETVSRLLRHVHGELTANVRREIEVRGESTANRTLPELLAGRDWLFAENNYHLDASHLAATVRLARLVEDPADLQRAWELTEYGRRLGDLYHFPGEEPFAQTYAAHGLWYAALLGRDVDRALEHFASRARDAQVRERSSLAAEIYVSLLARLGRWAEALEASAELIPPGTQPLGVSPTLVELGTTAGLEERLAELCRQRGDLVGFAAALVERS